jgi:glycosyltransferase involved in cell wall biosynthesis
MKYSIITATFNSSKIIESNLNSVLEQTYEDFEHIIIDNLSTDGTVELVTELYAKASKLDKLKIISEKDQGISDAFNKGIRNARGDFLIILSSDDYFFSPTSLESVAKEFRKGADIVHGDVFYIDDDFGNQVRKPLNCDIEVGMPFNHPATFYRSNIFKKFGLFELRYRYAMDYEHTARFYRSVKDAKCKIHYLPKTLVALRAGGASSQNELKSLFEIRSFLKKKDLWNLKAQKNHFFRVTRIRLKSVLMKLGLKKLVILWRRLKWS